MCASVAGEFVCTACSAQCPTRSTLESHFGGERHRKRASKHRVYRCDLCVVVAGSEDALNQHLHGQAHEQRVTKGSWKAGLSQARC